MMMESRPNYHYRLAGLAMILGGMLMIPIHYFWLLSHGPTGFDERNLVFGLLHNDYQRLSLIPLLLVLPGLRALHHWQRDVYGRLGLAGYRLTFVGYSLMAIGIAPVLLFDFSEAQSILAAGFIIGVLGGLLVFTGWLVWGISSVRAKTLAGWKAILPFYMGLAFLVWLVETSAYGVIPDTVRIFLQGIGFVLLGALLWIVRREV